jgi:hypothetical protein
MDRKGHSFPEKNAISKIKPIFQGIKEAPQGGNPGLEGGCRLELHGTVVCEKSGKLTSGILCENFNLILAGI